MNYSAEQDRLRLRVGTTDKKEYQFMLTRRFVRVLWAALIKVLEKQPDLKRDLMPRVKKAVMARSTRKPSAMPISHASTKKVIKT